MCTRINQKSGQINDSKIFNRFIVNFEKHDLQERVKIYFSTINSISEIPESFEAYVKINDLITNPKIKISVRDKN